MKLYIKQHVFSWGDKFSVFDESGNEIYYVEGKILSIGKKLYLYDSAHNELAFIQQKVLSFLPKYFIFKNEAQIAEIVKQFTFFRQEYTVKGPGWKVSGDFTEHNYSISGAGNEIARITKQWFSWGDTYEIAISDGIDVSMVLSVVLVIDACLEEENEQESYTDA